LIVKKRRLVDVDDLIKIENWNGHEIRFVWHNGEWWAVARDVAKALEYPRTRNMYRIIGEEDKDAHIVSTHGGKQKMTIISEAGIYEAIFNSRREEAKEFKKWVKQVLKHLREATGLEGFQIFRMLDKEHQKEMMKKLKEGLKQPTKVDYIKANSIADKAISNLFGFPKMVKKKEMTPEMLIKREAVLEDTVELMALKEKYGLDISVSQAIYNKYKGTA
jgi:prophage antirepressor-like protein